MSDNFSSETWASLFSTWLKFIFAALPFGCMTCMGELGTQITCTGSYGISQPLNKSTLDNSPPPNYDKESKDESHHVNNNPRYKWYVKPAAFQVIAPTRSNYGRKINVKNRNKSTILIFLPAIIELVQELLISNMHNKLEEDTCENVEVIAPTRSNYWRKMRTIAINRPSFFFFGHYWTSPRTTY